MNKFIKPLVSMLTVCAILSFSTAAKALDSAGTALNNQIEKIEASAPTSDFGNQVKSIQITVKDASNYNFKASDFHIEFPTVVNGATQISKQAVKDIKIEGNKITLSFDAFAYNQKFNIVCDANSKLNFNKDNIKFDLGDADKFLKRTYQGSYTTQTLNYRLFVPKTTEKAPLVLVLHGGGEIGSDNEAQLVANDMVTGFASDAQQAIHKAYVVAPQLPAELKVNVATTGKLGWNEEKVKPALIEIIKGLEKEYPNIDQSRIYVAGCSMGAMGTWGLITTYPGFFTAAMPVCGQGDIALMDKVKNLPIWAFHATNDPIVPMYGQKDQYKYNNNIIGTKTLVYRLKELGSNIKFTEYSTEDMLKAGVPVDKNVAYNHFAWVPAFNNQEAINWLFSQKK
ncbi:putative peptidase [Clostridium saccharoperbutylacetonicum]|uniref:Putative peptidase n=1 Tax=Clostridium saccharoperbutylacetonicum N1-4(HMT) TaxID=931276 RepID=M1M0L6_9CLOT|nr:prolyl oligopeptidase family serine peptidase [Clostridium saccharoperbutylacetonicum]AGF59120.1 putative peptidase [Clostridium saccharoperbutylacetonicum N1-4(HMT)]NRT60092.1 putative peptidase [Clostridium saccharoperbutylacetonicum]NSB23404.1 putative peptidase [Clostridium saccharoperbutylacetonicum]NSB42774.1 putative peptidase [Clostridium saccharoperbutylacetonicum]